MASMRTGSHVVVIAERTRSFVSTQPRKPCQKLFELTQMGRT